MRPLMTAAHAREISNLSRRHAAEREELQERQFQEMTRLTGGPILDIDVIFNQVERHITRRRK